MGQVGIHVDEFVGFSNDREFVEMLISEQSVFCLPASVCLVVLSWPVCVCSCVNDVWHAVVSSVCSVCCLCEHTTW